MVSRHWNWLKDTYIDFSHIFLGHIVLNWYAAVKNANNSFEFLKYKSWKIEDFSVMMKRGFSSHISAFFLAVIKHLWWIYCLLHWFTWTFHMLDQTTVFCKLISFIIVYGALHNYYFLLNITILFSSWPAMHRGANLTFLLLGFTQTSHWNNLALLKSELIFKQGFKHFRLNVFDIIQIWGKAGMIDLSEKMYIHTRSFRTEHKQNVNILNKIC